MVKSDLRAEVGIWQLRVCAMHLAIIIGAVRLLWTWLWGRYHVTTFHRTYFWSVERTNM